MTSRLGQAGYEAYVQSIGSKAFEMPSSPWGLLPAEAQKAWESAAKAIAREVYQAVKAAEEAPPETEPAPAGYPHVR